MKIHASAGNAPRNTSITTSVYSLKLTAQTIGEREWLAELFKAVRKVDPESQELKGLGQGLRIVEID